MVTGAQVRFQKAYGIGDVQVAWSRIHCFVYHAVGG